jgi:hypothetical protein
MLLCVARGAALAESFDKPAVNDKPIVKKAPKPSASKAKPDKNQYWLLNPAVPGAPDLYRIPILFRFDSSRIPMTKVQAIYPQGRVFRHTLDLRQRCFSPNGILLSRKLGAFS